MTHSPTPSNLGEIARRAFTTRGDDPARARESTEPTTIDPAELDDPEGARNSRASASTRRRSLLDRILRR